MSIKDLFDTEAFDELFSAQSGGRQFVTPIPEAPAKMNDAAFLGEEEYLYHIRKDQIETEGAAENRELVQREEARQMPIVDWVNQGWFCRHN